MPISIAPTSLLPLGEQPTRISVRLSRDLLKSIDPTMQPLEDDDSFTRVRRKGKAAINQTARDVSTALFGAELPTLESSFTWSKHVTGPGNTGYMKAHHYFGFMFDHHVTAENDSPMVLELTADDEVDGTIVFHVVELAAQQRDFINKALGRKF